MGFTFYRKWFNKRRPKSTNKANGMKSFLFNNNLETDTFVDEMNDISPTYIRNTQKKEKELKKQISELKEQLKIKDRFIQVIAQDLRKPFNVLLGISKLLTKNVQTYDKSKIEEMLSMNHQTIVKTYDLLEDLLTWTNSQTGNLPFVRKRISLHGVLKQSVDFFSNNARAKNIRLTLLCDEKLGVMADEFMMKTIVRNIISNAIKFTHTGGEVSISAKKSNDSILVSISDNGMGIDNRFLPEIWDSSSTYTTPGTAKEQGTGLGLIICKEFVEKHGGNIWAESELGKGTTFNFTLPE